MFEFGLDIDVLDGVDERPMFASKKYLWNLPVRKVRKWYEGGGETIWLTDRYNGETERQQNQSGKKCMLLILIIT